LGAIPNGECRQFQAAGCWLPVNEYHLLLFSSSNLIEAILPVNSNQQLFLQIIQNSQPDTYFDVCNHSF
jgi:hypothetical protein